VLNLKLKLESPTHIILLGVAVKGVGKVTFTDTLMKLLVVGEYENEPMLSIIYHS
jgi:hypothetical protein